MQKLKLFLATIFGGIALLGAALPQSDKPTHSDSDKPKLTFSDDKNAADHPVPTQRMVMIGKQAVVRITAPGCNDWNVWARVTDLFSNETKITPVNEGGWGAGSGGLPSGITFGRVPPYP
jgi:predicted phage tail protein